jgi:hypothetical protein
VADLLLERFIRAFPKKFLTHLMERQKPIYQQSIALAYNESWSFLEAFSVWPYIRRGLMESDLRKTAIECGLKPFDMQHKAENSSYVMVKADGIILTEHFVDGPRQFVRDAVSRKQNAGVNAWLPEHVDERLLISPLPKLGREPIYMNLLHGAHVSVSESGIVIPPDDTYFLRIAIPDDESRKYLYNWSAQEILMAYSSVLEEADVQREITDTALPRKKSEIINPKRSIAENA